jgi:hypothetical protein
MPVFKIHRMKDQPRQSFRWAPHTAGAAQAKPRDYEPAGQAEAPTIYAAWTQLQRSESPLGVGDILEDPSGGLRIFKYVGFEEARWLLPTPPPAATPEPCIIRE